MRASKTYSAAVAAFVKRRGHPTSGSIPDALQMFVAEVRFYREIASVVGVRVPACYHTEVTPDGTLLELEDLSSWQPGADPVDAARLLRSLHERWKGKAETRWPWLRPVGAAAELVGELFDRVWPVVSARGDCTPRIRSLGGRLVGRIPAVERASLSAGVTTLVHGDASLRNMRTSPGGQIALLDWEDVGAAPGVSDLAWLLLSSVQPARWEEVVAAYGTASGLLDVLPAAASQALLCFADTPVDSEDALAWVCRLEAAAHRLG